MGWGTTTTPIKHLVVIFDENISFDHYFGTYPNATNPAGEPAFHAKPNTPTVNGLTPALLTDNPNSTNPYRLDRSSALTFGMIIVTDDQTPKVDREFILCFHDIYEADIPQLSQDFDCFNGVAFLGNTPTFEANVGEHVRWRIMALGTDFHVFHLHGHRWMFNGRYDDSSFSDPPRP